MGGHLFTFRWRFLTSVVRKLNLYVERRHPRGLHCNPDRLKNNHPVGEKKQKKADDQAPLGQTEFVTVYKLLD
jgi:hypothetical protein